ncbi:MULTISPECIES: hypothetical protein [Nitrosopumilus]|uniref:Uncharacterized protein n=1 Tax=Nitrosopumilus piranensis TaxID=1582439 RepID=A0A0C5BRA8_9ARCH|nr:MULTISPECIES: hypothetical protein [Nitrosopumilus]AJM92293.1 hypothetical protein NPIRD3C_1081 [Nitrosopumilus piranensis]KAF6244235.1 hypothetical protein C6989_08030 [Nitrosopumilus sp. b2]
MEKLLHSEKSSLLHEKNVKKQKLFDTCKLGGRWKRTDSFTPHHYVALGDGASLNLSMIGANYTELFRFKKNSEIIIKDSIAEFYEEDLIR